MSRGKFQKANLPLPSGEVASEEGVVSCSSFYSVLSLDLPLTFSMLSSQNAVIANLYREDEQIMAVVLDYDPTTAGIIQIG